MLINKPYFSFENNIKKWEPVLLGDVLKINSGRDYKHLNVGETPVYGTGGYMLSVDQSLSKENAIGIGRKGTIDKPQLLYAPFWTVDTLFFMTPQKNNDLYFLYTYMQKINWKSYDESSGVPSLSKLNIEKIDMFVPNIEEQIQIGSFFKDLDDLIFLHQQELDALKKTKQGFLQKMFPKEGQSLPEIRFKEFLSPWKEYRLSELSEVTTGKAFKSTDFKSNGEYLVITNKNIQDEENEINSKGDRINISDEVILNKYLLSGKNILVTMDGVNIGKTGRYSNNMAVLAQRVGRINSEQFEFIYQITKSPKFISTMNQISVGNAIKHISLQQIADYSFMAPTEIAERLKIGEFFKDIDELILLVEKKIKGLQSTKKGFLQKMFV